MPGERPNPAAQDQQRMLADKKVKASQLLRDKNVFGKQGTERNTAAWEVVEQMGGAKGLGVMDWREATRDPNRNSEQAQLNLRALGAVVYDEVFFQGTAEQQQALVLGPKAIDKLLPQAFKGLGETMADRFASPNGENGDIARVLRGVDEVVNGDVGALVKARQNDIIRDAIEQINQMDTLGSSRREAVKAAGLRVLRQELAISATQTAAPQEPARRVNAAATAPATGTETAGANPRVEPATASPDELSAIQLEYYKEELELKTSLEVVSKEEWLDGLMTKSYEKAQIPARWMYKAPEWMNRVNRETHTERSETQMLSEWRGLYALAEGASYAVVQRHGDSKLGGDVDYIKTVIIGMYAMREKKLKYMYEDPKGLGLGFRGVLEALVDDLLVMDESQNILVFKPENPGNSVELFYRDTAEYKKQLAERLLNDNNHPEIHDIEQAQIMVSIASDFLEMGGVYDLADTDRRLSDSPDAIRTLMRPDQKFGPKIKGGELWGGPWGLWAMTLTGNNGEEAARLLEETNITPKLLSGSALNLMVEVDGGQKVSLGRALKNKMNIHFEDKAGDFYFSWKKDQIMQACDMWKYISGKNKLQFKSFQDTTQPISDWRGDLFGAVRGLRKVGEKLKLDLVPTRVVAAAIGASTTVWPFKPLFLRVDQSDEAIRNKRFYDDYIDTSGSIIRSVAQSETERLELMSIFGVSSTGVRKLFNMANDYDYVTNETVDLPARKRVQARYGWKFV